ncbi:hypothetical protein ACHQM5_029796 [Ranunculus cassubicifolius]
MTGSKLITLSKHQTTIVVSKFLSPCSSTGIDDLPDDVLLEILCKLPIKQMAFCKCVSKLWNIRISNISLRRVESNLVYGLIFNIAVKYPARGEWGFYDTTSNRVEYLEVSFLGTALPFDPSPEALLDCYDGLLLYFDRASMQCYLCNPCTQQNMAIPNSPGDLIHTTSALFFDTHYKIVNMGGEPAIMNIFSLATREWSVHNLDEDLFTTGRDWSPHYIFLHGSIYRLCVGQYVLKVELNPVCCRRIELPDIARRCIPCGCLGVSKGVLHYGRDDLQTMMVWILESGTDGTIEWVLKYTIGFDYFKNHPASRIICGCLCLQVIAFHPTADKMIIGNTKGIFLYDPATRELELIFVLCKRRSFYSHERHVYLFSPNITCLEALCQKNSEFAHRLREVRDEMSYEEA